MFIEVGNRNVLCWKVLLLYTPLKAIEADVRNAPDIVDLNVKYPVEYSAGIGKRSGEEAGCCSRRQRDAAEDTLSAWGRALRIEVR